MKYLERTFYRGYWHFGNGSSPTIKNWLYIKDTIFRGIRRVTKRHRRSIVQRDLHRLFPRLVLRIDGVWLKDDDWGIAPLDYPCRKDRLWKGCRRLWVKE